MHRTLHEKVQARICYTGTKLDTKFKNIKDPVKKSHPQANLGLLTIITKRSILAIAAVLDPSLPSLPPTRCSLL